MNKKITEMYAFVILNDGLGQGDEGIPAFKMGNMSMPLTGADMERIDSIRPIAQDAANSSGSKIELRHWTQMEVLEVLEPEENSK